MIREYKDSDFEALRRCFSLLQDYERDFEPLRLPADEMADAYLAELFKQMEKHRGKIFVAIAESESGDAEVVAGYISLLGKLEFDPDLNQPTWIAYITDLIVLPEYRKGGVAQQLMKVGDDYARSQGAKSITLNVLADNKMARRFYEKEGYRDYQLRLIKEL